MIPLTEFERELATCEMVEDFVKIVSDFIASIEDPTLRTLVMLELETTLLEGQGRVDA
ncbi:MAG: hypothetical protein WBC70_14565 [Candidatus Aminicenantales bacterium]